MELLEEISDSSLRYVQKKGINPKNLTVLGICAGNSPAAMLASKLGVKNLYVLLSVGRISDGLFSSDATKQDVIEFGEREFTKKDCQELVGKFDPLNYIDLNVENVIGVFGDRKSVV